MVGLIDELDAVLPIALVPSREVLNLQAISLTALALHALTPAGERFADRLVELGQFGHSRISQDQLAGLKANPLPAAHQARS